MFGDPFFRLVEDSRQNMLQHTIPNIPDDGFMLPWHNLQFWYSLNKLRSSLSPEVRIFPGRGVLKGIGMKFDNLTRIVTPVGNRCAGQFDMTPYDETFLVIFNHCDSRRILPQDLTFSNN